VELNGIKLGIRRVNKNTHLRRGTANWVNHMARNTINYHRKAVNSASDAFGEGVGQAPQQREDGFLKSARLKGSAGRVRKIHAGRRCPKKEGRQRHGRKVRVPREARKGKNCSTAKEKKVNNQSKYCGLGNDSALPD